MTLLFELEVFSREQNLCVYFPISSLTVNCKLPAPLPPGSASHSAEGETASPVFSLARLFRTVWYIYLDEEGSRG